MKQIPFTKMTMLGNNFVIVNELSQCILTESEKSDFAFLATNPYYGIGADNFLVVQPCLPNVLADIQQARHYWEEIPDFHQADYIFRMFEPTGEEAFSCGNGLLCIAQHLYQTAGRESVRIITEIPTKTPKVVHIGTNSSPSAISWTSLGEPTRLTSKSGMLGSSIEIVSTRDFDLLNNITIDLSAHPPSPLHNSRRLSLSGHLVFTGEPHFVIFPDLEFSQQEISTKLFFDAVFPPPSLNYSHCETVPGSWLVHYIGTYINRHYAEMFPVGLNVDFVRIVESTGTLEYRCFERGIYRETLSCGTGSVAVAFVASRLNLCSPSEVIVWPYRSRLYDPTSEVFVKEIGKDWVLSGRPLTLYEGVFKWDAEK